MDELLTPEDLLKLFKVSRKTIDNWVADGVLPKPIKMGRRIFWKRSEIDAYLESSRK